MAIDHKKLRDLAQAAHPGPWKTGPFNSHIFGERAMGGEVNIADIRGWGYYTGKGHGALGLSNEDARAQMDANAEYIAAVHPGVILELLDQLAARLTPA